MDARRHLAELLATREPTYTLPQPFYGDAAFHQLDLELIWHRTWLFAGPECSIPASGNWFTLDVGSTSLIVVRGNDGALRAFYNTCRHRGSKLCTAEHGKSPNLVCPYHQWTYNLQGRLLFARDMGSDFDASRFPLKAAHCRTVGGYVFVCLAETPPDFDEFARAAEPYMAPHALKDAKVAHMSSAIERGNWKLVMENNRECYHCSASHPELLRTLAEFDSTDDPRVSPEFRQRILKKQSQWTAQGLLHEVQQDPGHRWRVVRLPYIAGESMTMDGQPAVKRLLGNLTDADLGSMRLLHLPNTWNHLQSDHTVAFRVLPVGPRETLVTTWWLVHKDAKEGVDYELDHLTQVWNATNEQDRRLVETNQAGIANKAYEPGPYGQASEFGVQHFIDWYTAEMQAGLATTQPVIGLRAA
jgi:glycine betaine catabolism A